MEPILETLNDGVIIADDSDQILFANGVFEEMTGIPRSEVDGEALAARVAFEFDLRNITTGVTVWSHYYSHDEPVNRRDVTAVVASMNRNVQSCLNEVLESLDQYFSTHVPKRSTADTHISQ